MQNLTENSHLLRGSPHTILYKNPGVRETTIIDPGHGEKRVKQLLKLLQRLQAPLKTVLLTHSHSDHSNNACHLPATSVRAPHAEIPALHHVPLRTALTFGLPLEQGDVLMLHPQPALCAQPLDTPPAGITPVPLPGHTMGHHGYLLEDGVFYAGDSLFGDQVIYRYGVPYHLDTFRALETLEDTLAKLADEGHLIVPSHGPPSQGEEVQSLIELNAQRLRDTIDAVRRLIAREPLTLSEIVAGLHKTFSVEPTPTSLLLIETGARGVIAGLYTRGEAEPTVAGGLLKWRLTRK